MLGLINKKFNIVVMDGSDNEHIKSIIGIVAMMTGMNDGKITCRDLDGDHPTTKVIEFKARKNLGVQAQEIIEEVYPALCSFNVNL